MDVLGSSVLTLPQTLSFLAARGLSVPIPGGNVSTDWVSNIYSVVASFMEEMVLARLVPTVAAYFVIRAVLDAAEGNTPLKSVLTAMFLLAVSTTLSLMSSFNSGGSWHWLTCLTDCGTTWLEGSCQLRLGWRSSERF